VRALAALFVLLTFVGCNSIPPLEDWERYQVSARRSEKPGECIIRVTMLTPPPPPIAHYLTVGEPKIVDGEVQLELHGWHKDPKFPNEPELMVEVKVGVRAGVPFTFVLQNRGHEDRYRITVPLEIPSLPPGPPTIEPASGEFSERG
jgi:hypothetical protein